MKAVVIAALTYWRIFPIQRWLAYITLALTALAVALRSAPLIVVIVIPAACLMAAVLGPLGLLFRQISGVRAHRLLPHFRPQMLAAVVLVLAFFPAAGYVLLSFAPYPPPALAWFVIALLAASAWLWFGFFLPKSILTALVAIPVAVLIPQLAADSAYFLTAVAAALGAAWIAFAVWYLRAATITSLGPFQQWFAPAPALDALDARLSDRTGRYAAENAVDAYLTGRYPQRLMQKVYGAAVLLTLFCLLLSLPLAVGGRRVPDALIAAVFIAVIAVLVAVANLFARRARGLWLIGGKSRRELFGATERAVWIGPLLAYVAVYVGFGAFAWVTYGTDLLWRAVPVSLSSSILAVYLGLACVRHTVWTSWLATLFVASLAIAAIISLVFGHSGVFAGIVAAELAAALAARAIGIRLWERIDWTVLRPPRLTVARARLAN